MRKSERLSLLQRVLAAATFRDHRPMGIAALCVAAAFPPDYSFAAMEKWEPVTMNDVVKRALILATVPLVSVAAIAGNPHQVVVVLTVGTSWTVPANFNPNNNKIEAIGGGADGLVGNSGTTTIAGDGGTGRGAGAYTFITNFDPVGASTIAYAIGDRGVTNGGDTQWKDASTLLAKGASSTTGGAAASCVPSGNAKSGGNGGAGRTHPATSIGGGGGGGGGAGGPTAAGANGIGGGTSATGNNGGQGDPAVGGGAGTGSASDTVGGAGGAGSELGGGVGSGGGGGGGGGGSSDNTGAAGGAAGNYGAGGGGGGGGGKAITGGTRVGGAGGLGKQGVIIITYQTLF